MKYRNLIIAGLGMMAMLSATVGAQTNGGKIHFALQEFSLGKIPVTAGGGKPLVSADNRRVAYPVMHRGKWCISLNGQEGELYAKVDEVTFSADGMRVAYAARKTLDRNVVVFDGKESREYAYSPFELTFSPDSQRLAYGTGNATNGFVVLDGQPGKDFETLCGAGPSKPQIFFSPDSKKLAYSAMRKMSDGSQAWEVVIYGEENKVYPTKDIAIVYGFSRDSQHLAWSVNHGSRWQVVIDGEAGPMFDEIGEGTFSFSGNGKENAYCAHRGDKWLILHDGKEGSEFEGITVRPVFSPDGRQLAYAGTIGGKQYVVQNGKESEAYDSILAGTLKFSPDSRHIVFSVSKGGQRYVVRDGKESEGYDDLPAAMFFSPDSQHLAYVAVNNGRTRFVVDDKAGKEYDGSADKWACFSPDSKHLAYGAVRAGKLVVVADGQEIGTYEGNLGTLKFDGPNLLLGVVTRLDEMFNFELVRLEIEVGSK